MGADFKFYENQRLRVDGSEYRVKSGIEYYNSSDESRWMEYSLVSGSREQWLSIDPVYEEYAIYTQYPYGEEFQDENIFHSGYKEADSGMARVTSFFGPVDVDMGECVTYTEYEDGEGEKLISTERWQDETEYSRGYYLDANEIVLLDTGGESDKSKAGGGKEERRSAVNWVPTMILIGVILAVVIGAVAFSYLTKMEKSIQKFLEKDSSFTYTTSITSDLNQKEKADVYKTALTIEEAVKLILEGIDGQTEKVQKSDEDTSVAILTEKEYCLVYTSEEQVTMVQISSRAYAFQSTNAPYHASSYTHSYYRRFYYSRGYWGDSSKYHSSNNGYRDYSGGDVAADPNDTYQNYSNSIRQSSVNSRISSGGGISSGK